MELKPHYDKLLHTTVTFVLMAFLCKVIPWGFAFMVTAVLQLVKAEHNRHKDSAYSATGDMLANGIGYLVFWLYTLT